MKAKDKAMPPHEKLARNMDEQCSSFSRMPGYYRRCQLRKGHVGKHFGPHGREWPKSRNPAKKRIKVGEWVCTFGKVTGLHGRNHLVVQIGPHECTLLRSEVWNPDDVREGRK